jgi:hypothetical protein
MKYGLEVFIEGTITNNNLHGEKYNQIFTQTSGYNILFSHNMWLRVEEIKMEQGLL